ncbi:MAG: LCP family protein [Peptococcaceae bacterium]|nr:LCP family protein [Peptococcaceae bacterium]
MGGKGNIDQLKTEIRYLMGFEVDNYIVVNLDAFEEIIDALGGVKIDVQRDMHYEDPYQDLYIHIEKGEQILNGEEAIGFVRYRKGYAEGDLGRVKAQQQFIEALAKQVATPATVGKLPKLSSIILENMTTDLTTGELIWFGTKALELNMAEDLTMHILPGEARTVNGLSYYVPKKKELLEIVNNHFNPYPNMITQLNVIDVATIPQPVEKVEEEVVEEVVTEGEVLEGEASETLEDEAGENGVINEATNTENENVVSDENTEGSNEVLTEETPAEVQGETAEEITEETTEDNAEDNAEEINTEETNTGETNTGEEE